MTGTLLPVTTTSTSSSSSTSGSGQATTHKRRRLNQARAPDVPSGSNKPEPTPPYINPSPGSDTEEDDDEETNLHFLDKMADDTDVRVGTVFGAHVDVWRSEGGTIYADIDDVTRKKMRDEELWGPKGNTKVIIGVKRPAEEMEAEDKIGEVDYPVLPAVPEVSEYPPVPAPPGPAAPYRPRSVSDTRFNHGSAGVDPQGAHNRPIKPLPVRQKRGQTATGSPTAVGGPALTTRKIVSGSFGSFEAFTPSRFDERGYRLGPEAKAKAKTEKEGALDPFKVRPWLKR